MAKKGKKIYGATPVPISMAQYTNDLTYIDYYNRLKEMCLNVFEWKNLPPSIDERFLEMTLFEKGYAVYFNDVVMGNLALTCAIGGGFDVYRVPINRRAYANNGYNKNLTNKDSVLIYNNFLRTPTASTIRLFAERLCEVERTININVKSQKTPVLILSNEQQRQSMKIIYQQFDGNEPVIYGDNSLEMSQIQVLKTDAPLIADKLQVIKNQIWNEALTFCGIENSNADKKERLVADEVGSNYGNIEAQRNVMLNARRQAVEKINAMFGTNIEVNFRSNLLTMVNAENVSRETLIESGEVDTIE